MTSPRPRSRPSAADGAPPPRGRPPRRLPRPRPSMISRTRRVARSTSSSARRAWTRRRVGTAPCTRCRATLVSSPSRRTPSVDDSSSGSAGASRTRRDAPRRRQRHPLTAPGRHPLTVTSAPSLDGRRSVDVAKARGARGRRRRGVSRACVARRTETPSSKIFERARRDDPIGGDDVGGGERAYRRRTRPGGDGGKSSSPSGDARDLFRRRVEELTSRAEDDARGRLEAIIVAVSAEDFAPNVRGERATKTNRRTPTRATRSSRRRRRRAWRAIRDGNGARSSDARALYVAHIERLCAEVGVDVPEDVAALGDELARASGASGRRRKRTGKARGGKTRARSGDAMILFEVP